MIRTHTNQRFIQGTFLAVFITALFLIAPYGTSAATEPVSDPTGRGWSCVRDTSFQYPDVRCTDPQDSNKKWVQSCTLSASDRTQYTLNCRVSSYVGNRETFLGQHFERRQKSDDALIGAPISFNSSGAPQGEDTIVPIEGSVLTTAGQEAIENVTGFFANITLAAILTPVVLLSFVILSFASFLLWLAGILFNWSMAYLVFNFGTFFGNSTGLLLAWGILRDFGNIILLFGFVYMGIQTILNIGHFSVGKTLSRLVIFAILLNFSLFISQAVIDVSNALASTLYSQTARCDLQDFSCLVDQGIASEILDRANIISTLSSSATLEQAGSIGGSLNEGGFVDAATDYFSNPIGETLKYLGLALLVVTAAVVLIAGALFLIARAVHLTFLMVVSPIGFAGMAIPWFEKMAKDWWDQLIKQAMFAPVFLLLLFVSLKLLDGLDGLAGNGGGIGAAITSQGSLDTGPILYFALVIGFMIGALMVAKQFGIYAADSITKTGLSVIGRTAGASTFGVGGWMARRTIGGASTAIARNLRTSSIGRIPILGRQLTAIADAGAKASFDARSVLKTGADLGAPSKAAKGGRIGEIEAVKKANEEHAKSMVEEDKKKYNLLKSEKSRLRDKIDAKLGSYDLSDDELRVAAAMAAPGTATAAMASDIDKMTRVGKDLDAKMKYTTEGKRKKEADKKEDLDSNVKNWSENNSRLETIKNKLLSIEKDLTRPAVVGDLNLVSKLMSQKYDLETERKDTLNQQSEIQDKVMSLRTEIKSLRNEIKKEESQYRRNIHELATHAQVGGLSPFDVQGLREAVVSIKKDLETPLKPKNIDEALGRKLRIALNLPHP